MQFGVDSFAAAISDPATGLPLTPVERMQHLLQEMKLADKVGLDVFGIGEHHRAEFLDSAPVVILAAAAAQTKNIRLTSALTVLSGKTRSPPGHPREHARSLVRQAPRAAYGSSGLSSSPAKSAAHLDRRR